MSSRDGELEGRPAAETLILTTTNGTRLLVAAAQRFERVYVGSLLNVDAVAAAARESGEDAAVLCAGVLLGPGASIWHGAVVRTESEPTRIRICSVRKEGDFVGTLVTRNAETERCRSDEIVYLLGSWSRASNGPNACAGM